MGLEYSIPKNYFGKSTFFFPTVFRFSGAHLQTFGSHVRAILSAFSDVFPSPKIHTAFCFPPGPAITCFPSFHPTVRILNQNPAMLLFPEIIIENNPKNTAAPPVLDAAAPSAVEKKIQEPEPAPACLPSFIADNPADCTFTVRITHDEAQYLENLAEKCTTRLPQDLKDRLRKGMLYKNHIIRLLIHWHKNPGMPHGNL